jgi:hypothetical protein
MVTRVQTVAGNVGYRHQLDRARRFLEYVLREPDDWHDMMSEVEFQDMMWSFFQHCWHVKDWILNDPLASTTQKEAACEMAHKSDVLRICQDLCNGTKHLQLRRPGSGSGASHRYVDATIDPGAGRFERDCMFDDGRGNLISGKKLARECIAEWERILASQGLPTVRLS